MKKSNLALLIFCSILTLAAPLKSMAADNGDVPLPSDATLDTSVSGVNTSGNNNNHDLHIPLAQAPMGSDVKGYADYRSIQYDTETKNHLIDFTQQDPARPKSSSLEGSFVNCLKDHNAYRFIQSKDGYDVKCLAGTSKGVNHVLVYHMQVNYTPAGCNASVNIQKKIVLPANAAAAMKNMATYQSLLGAYQCQVSLGLTTAGVDSSKTNPEAFALSADDVEKQAAAYGVDISSNAAINGSKTAKAPLVMPQDTSVSNPFKDSSDDSDGSADAK